MRARRVRARRRRKRGRRGEVLAIFLFAFCFLVGGGGWGGVLGGRTGCGWVAGEGENLCEVVRCCQSCEVI